MPIRPHPSCDYQTVGVFSACEAQAFAEAYWAEAHPLEVFFD
jgi:hypothetical protein